MTDLKDVGEDSGEPSHVSGEKEDQSLNTDTDKLAKAQVKSANQNIFHRRIVIFMAVSIILALSFMEYRVLEYIFDPHSQVETIFIFLAISPIVSISFIMVFLIFGVYRGSQEVDLKDIPWGDYRKTPD